MLQAIRSKASSFVVKILFALLIVTFGIWGIGDIFQNRGTDTTVATVGDQDVSAAELSQAVQTSIQRLSQKLGKTIDAAQAKKMGVVDGTLQDLINVDLLNLEIKRLGLEIGDDTVRNTIMSNAAFHNEKGQFDRNLYLQLLAANHISEQEFETETRAQLLQEQLLTAITDGVSAPRALTVTLFRHRNEQRVADFVQVPAAAAGTIAKPTEAEIAAYYKSHSDQYQAPEMRNFTLATLTLPDVAAGVTVSAADLQQAYKTHQDEFHTPEQRHLVQLLLPDAAAAKKAETELAAGKDFAAVAKDVVKTADPAVTDLGWVSLDDLPQDLGDAAFALKEGGTSKPIKSAFGWHVLRLEGVKPASELSFDEAKAKLTKEVVQDRAADEIADTANHIDDAIAGGATFKDVVAKFNLKTTNVADIDDKGNGPDGKPVTLPKPGDAILHTAFATDAGQTSPLTELGNVGYFIVHVDKVTPSRPKPLAAIHDQVATAWQDAQRQAALQKLAQAMADEVNAGKSLKDVAAAHGLTIEATAPFLRSASDAKVPATLVTKLFDTKPKKAVTDTAAGKVVVAELIAIIPSEPDKQLPALQQLFTAVASEIQQDLVQEYTAGLRQTFPVEINKENIDRLM
jgi:peptidyl-prolyl cis-trans isomerase D